MSENAPLQHLDAFGYGDLLTDVIEVSEKKIEAYGCMELIDGLRDDGRFKEGIFHGLHPKVGRPRTEFRSHTNELGDDTGSLQVVINTVTFFLEADVDKHGPYTDLVSMVRHNVEEVIWPKLKGWFT